MNSHDDTYISSSYPTDYSYDINHYTNPLNLSDHNLNNSDIEFYTLSNANKNNNNNKKHKKLIKSNKKLSSTSVSHQTLKYSTNVRILIENTTLSKSDQYVVVPVKNTITIHLPKLKHSVPFEEHGKIKSSPSVINISSPRKDAFTHKIKCYNGNTINIDQKETLLKPHTNIKFVAYGKTWFIFN